MKTAILFLLCGTLSLIYADIAEEAKAEPEKAAVEEQSEEVASVSVEISPYGGYYDYYSYPPYCPPYYGPGYYGKGFSFYFGPGYNCYGYYGPYWGRRYGYYGGDNYYRGGRGHGRHHGGHGGHHKGGKH